MRPILRTCNTPILVRARSVELRAMMDLMSSNDR